jgi:hypothetical protein
MSLQENLPIGPWKRFSEKAWLAVAFRKGETDG